MQELLSYSFGVGGKLRCRRKKSDCGVGGNYGVGGSFLLNPPMAGSTRRARERNRAAGETPACCDGARADRRLAPIPGSGAGRNGARGGL